ncbi:MAG: inorganic phosphate transporter, partial [Bacteroidales bacterium]|nr:inorganic phosphate transporter [Bacteroidales bacterium]
MQFIFGGIIVFLCVLAVFDLVVGVSNDAVNFINSAIGAKAARFKTIIAVAAIGVFAGAAMSNGMMDVARHGIFTPQYFSFYEVICIFLAVMVTDVILLDIFNSLGMPTSTTVSLVFEMLGGAFALSLVKMAREGGPGLGELLNTDKALSVIAAIFLSVAVAFITGMLVMWISRLVFTFVKPRNGSLKTIFFGGVCATVIIWFLLINGLKGSAFMTPDVK